MEEKVAYIYTIEWPEAMFAMWGKLPNDGQWIWKYLKTA